MLAEGRRIEAHQRIQFQVVEVDAPVGVPIEGIAGEAQGIVGGVIEVEVVPGKIGPHDRPGGSVDGIAGAYAPIVGLSEVEVGNELLGIVVVVAGIDIGIGVLAEGGRIEGRHRIQLKVVEIDAPMGIPVEGIASEAERVVGRRIQIDVIAGIVDPDDRPGGGVHGVAGAYAPVVGFSKVEVGNELLGIVVVVAGIDIGIGMLTEGGGIEGRQRVQFEVVEIDAPMGIPVEGIAGEAEGIVGGGIQIDVISGGIDPDDRPGGGVHGVAGAYAPVIGRAEVEVGNELLGIVVVVAGVDIGIGVLAKGRRIEGRYRVQLEVVEVDAPMGIPIEGIAGEAEGIVGGGIEVDVVAGGEGLGDPGRGVIWDVGAYAPVVDLPEEQVGHKFPGIAVVAAGVDIPLGEVLERRRIEGAAGIYLQLVGLRTDHRGPVQGHPGKDQGIVGGSGNRGGIPGPGEGRGEEEREKQS